MLAWKRPRIGLLFVGGTALSGSPVLSQGIRTDRDVRPWMTAAGEINMIAELDPVLIAPLGTTAAPNIWMAIADFLHREHAAYDGFVILHEPRTAALTAIALAAMIRSIGIPIVVTPGREHGEEGGRANLINALQTATFDLSGVVYLDGPHIFDARALEGSSHGIGGRQIGRIDFGIRLSKQVKRHERPAAIIRHLETRVTVVPVSPFTDPLIPPRSAGVVFACDPLALPSPAIWRKVKLPPTTATVIVGADAAHGPVGALAVAAPPLNASLQLMAALGERPKLWRRTMQSMNPPRP